MPEQRLSIDTSRITPTMHYTGYVWVRHGLAPRSWATDQGRGLYHFLKPGDHMSRLFKGGVSLEALLLQRHLILDYLVCEEIKKGCRLIVEAAAGLSGRGLRLARRFPEVTYVETDLRTAVEIKRQFLQNTESLPANLHVREMNVLAREGEDSLQGLREEWKHVDGPAVLIMEGLANYFEGNDLSTIWTNAVQFIRHQPGGVFFSDYHLSERIANHQLVRGFAKVLGKFAKGGIYFPFKDEEELRKELLRVGFANVYCYSPCEFSEKLRIPRFKKGDILSVIEARP